jgi:hypothetical protein
LITQNNNKPNHYQIRDSKPFNDFLATNLDATINDRYCQRCHLKMVHNPRNTPYDRYIYSCPQCNCTANIHNTEPSEKLVTMFPTHNAITGISGGNNKKSVTQPDNQRLSRSQYFIQKNMQKKNEIENQDPHLAILKKNNKITITNVDYNNNNPPNEQYNDE